MIHEKIEEHKDLSFDRSLSEDDKAIDVGVKNKSIISSLVEFVKKEDYLIYFSGLNVPYVLFYLLGENADLYDFKTHTSYDKLYKMLKGLLTSDDDSNIHSMKGDHVLQLFKDGTLKSDEYMMLAYDTFFKSSNNLVSKCITYIILDRLLLRSFMYIFFHIMSVKKIKLKNIIQDSPSLYMDRINASLKSHFKFLQRLYLGTSKEKDLKDFKNSWDRIQDKIFNDDCNMRQIDELFVVLKEYTRKTKIIDVIHIWNTYIAYAQTIEHKKINVKMQENV